MSTMLLHPDTMTPPVAKKIGDRSLIVGVVFGLIALLGAFLRPQEFFRGYLLSYMDWLGVTLGSMAILMIRHLTGGGWGMVIRRILGAAMRCIPLMTLFFVPILLGLPYLYPWAPSPVGISNANIREVTRSYLSVHGFVIRAVVYFGIWNLLSFLLTRWSRETDQPGTRDHTSRFRAVSGPGLILYANPFTVEAIDRLVCLAPATIATIYAFTILIDEL